MNGKPIEIRFHIQFFLYKKTIIKEKIKIVLKSPPTLTSPLICTFGHLEAMEISLLFTTFHFLSFIYFLENQWNFKRCLHHITITHKNKGPLHKLPCMTMSIIQYLSHTLYIYISSLIIWIIIYILPTSLIIFFLFLFLCLLTQTNPCVTH